MRTAGRVFLLVVLAAALVLPVMQVMAQPESIALIGVFNHSGIAKIGSLNFSKAMADAVVGTFDKQLQGSLVSLKETEKRLKAAGLKDFPEVIDMCSLADLAAVGNRTGSTQVGLLELNGYQEIARTGEKTLYHVWITLRVIACQDGSVKKYQSEGWATDRKKALNNAAQNLYSTYAGQPAEANLGVRLAENQPVIVDTTSGRYHLVDSRHLPGSAHAKGFETRALAQAEGLVPCPICFPDFKSGLGTDPAAEDAIGSMVCRDIESFYRLGRNPDVLYRIEQVAAPLVADSSRYHITFRFRYLDDNEINAFGAANGYIYVTRGLLDAIESDDELAFVLAHEIAHIERQHQLSLYKGNERSDLLARPRKTDIVLKGYTKAQEAEADEDAMAHLKRVGRDWKVYRTFFGRLIDLKQYKIGKAVGAFSTHPSPEDRLKALDKLVEQYEAFAKALEKQQ